MLRWIFWWMLRLLVLCALVIVALRWINPPTNIYQASENRRLGTLKREWVPIEAIAPEMARAAIAAEDANFCLHWGIDLVAIQEVIESGSRRGASTITQQVAKNVFLWQARSYIRKALEAGLATIIDAVWGKRRVLEVYLNVAEFDEGVFGVQAASRHYFGVEAQALTAEQAARLAMVLPGPKTRSAIRPTASQQKRVRGILSGANTIKADGRADCI